MAIRDYDLSEAVRRDGVGFENHTLGRNVQAAVRTLVGHVAAVSRSVLDGDWAAEHGLDGLSLKVEQRLGRREHGVHPPRRSPALTLQKLREEIDRAGVAVEAQGPVLRDDPRVRGQRGLAEVECRDQPRVDEPVPQVAKAVLPRRLDR